MPEGKEHDRNWKVMWETYEKLIEKSWSLNPETSTMAMTKWLSGNQSGFCCYWALPPYGRLHLEEWLPSGFVKRGKSYKCFNHNMFLHLWNTRDSWVCKGKTASQAWFMETQYPAAYWEPTAITAKSKSTVFRVPSSNATEAQWASNSITSLGCRRFFSDLWLPHLSNWW